MEIRLCASCLEVVDDKERDKVYHVTCPRCGKYCITDEAYDDNTDKLNDRQRANISGWLYENQGYLISNPNFDILSKIKTPSFFERVDKLLLGVQKRTDYIGQFILPDKSYIQISSGRYRREPPNTPHLKLPYYSLSCPMTPYGL